ncbi:secreted protein [Candidatus Magnetomorum sp. HK-1]|nr:secreted protein [Candidatus Magnetomorum sp. HK-1]
MKRIKFLLFLFIYSSICYAEKSVYDAKNQYLGELILLGDFSTTVKNENYLIKIIVDQYTDQPYASVDYLSVTSHISENCSGQKYSRFYNFMPKLYYHPLDHYFYTLDYSAYIFDYAKSELRTSDNKCGEPYETKKHKLFPIKEVTNPPIQLPVKIPFFFVEKDKFGKDKVTMQKVINDLQVLSGKNQSDSFSFKKTIHVSGSAPSFIRFECETSLETIDTIIDLFGNYEGIWTEGNNQGGMVSVTLSLEGNTIKTDWHNGYGGDITLSIKPLQVIFNRENTTWNGSSYNENDIIVTWNFSDNSYSKFTGGYFFINTSSTGVLSGYKKG